MESTPVSITLVLSSLRLLQPGAIPPFEITPQLILDSVPPPAPPPEPE